MDFDLIAINAWHNNITPLEAFYDTLTGEQWREAETPSQRYRVFTATCPRKCRLCGRDDQWTRESDTVFVCEHEAIHGASFGCRQLDSVRVKDVAWKAL